LPAGGTAILVAEGGDEGLVGFVSEGLIRAEWPGFDADLSSIYPVQSGQRRGPVADWLTGRPEMAQQG
jgi:hypothetical protein